MAHLEVAQAGLHRDEFEYAIPVADTQAMLENHCARRIRYKTRYLVDHAHHVFEVDVFEGHHAGLVVAEVELPHECTPVSLPGWVEGSHPRHALRQLHARRRGRPARRRQTRDRANDASRHLACEPPVRAALRPWSKPAHERRCAERLRLLPTLRELRARKLPARDEHQPERAEEFIVSA